MFLFNTPCLFAVFATSFQSHSSLCSFKEVAKTPKNTGQTCTTYSFHITYVLVNFLTQRKHKPAALATLFNELPVSLNKRQTKKKRKTGG